jgi:putative flippase GtrA
VIRPPSPQRAHQSRAAARPRNGRWRDAASVSLQRLTTLPRRLPDRWRRLTHELAKFGTIGVINLFVNFAVFNLLFLTVLRGGELKAKAVAAIVATTSAYFMNRHWTYRDRPKSTLRREYSLFFFFNLVGMVIEVAVVGVAKYGLHQTSILALNISTAIGIGLGTLFRFWSYRTHVFKTEFGTPAGSGSTGQSERDGGERPDMRVRSAEEPLGPSGDDDVDAYEIERISAAGSLA